MLYYIYVCFIVCYVIVNYYKSKFKVFQRNIQDVREYILSGVGYGRLQNVIKKIYILFLYIVNYVVEYKYVINELEKVIYLV